MTSDSGVAMEAYRFNKPGRTFVPLSSWSQGRCFCTLSPRVSRRLKTKEGFIRVWGQVISARLKAETNGIPLEVFTAVYCDTQRLMVCRLMRLLFKSVWLVSDLKSKRLGTHSHTDRYHQWLGETLVVTTVDTQPEPRFRQCGNAWRLCCGGDRLFLCHLLWWCFTLLFKNQLFHFCRWEFLLPSRPQLLLNIFAHLCQTEFSYDLLSIAPRATSVYINPSNATTSSSPNGFTCSPYRNLLLILHQEVLHNLCSL